MHRTAVRLAGIREPWEGTKLYSEFPGKYSSRSGWRHQGQQMGCKDFRRKTAVGRSSNHLRRLPGSTARATDGRKISRTTCAQLFFHPLSDPRQCPPAAESCSCRCQFPFAVRVGYTQLPRKGSAWQVAEGIRCHTAVRDSG